MSDVVRLINELPASKQTLLMRRSVFRRLEKGESLFLAGEASERIHIVIAGVLKLCARAGDGSEAIVALAVEGELIGEFPALLGGSNPYDALAITSCELIGFDADLLIQALLSHPGAGLALVTAIAERSRWTCDALIERTAGNATARLAGRLLGLSELLGHRRGETIDVPLLVPQEDIARLSGMCRENACKILGNLRRAGVVDYSRKRLRILRPDALEKIRCAGRVSGPYPSTNEAGSRQSQPTAGI
jgi:CRP/FNR family transcriptional regulator, cyclic AMP receptor protein